MIHRNCHEIDTTSTNLILRVCETVYIYSLYHYRRHLGSNTFYSKINWYLSQMIQDNYHEMYVTSNFIILYNMVCELVFYVIYMS